MPKANLPENDQSFDQKIVDHLFADLHPEVRQRIYTLFNHAFDHPWNDDDLKSSIVNNICNEFEIVVPSEYEE